MSHCADWAQFEDVPSASRALSDLYGNTLGGLVKGGIRLSYSKNPLGVGQRTGSISAASPLLPGSATATSPYGVDPAGYYAAMQAQQQSQQQGYYAPYAMATQPTAPPQQPNGMRRPPQHHQPAQQQQFSPFAAYGGQVPPEFA